MAVTIDIPERYESPRRVGRGGMGDVWLVRDTQLERDVVIKVLRTDAAPDVLRRFEREARVAARLSGHPNVVTIHDVGEHDGRPFIVMEYLPGGTVAQRLRTGEVDLETGLRWLREAATAIDAAHEAGVVHRDIKPGNLLLDGQGSVRIADFGIARALDAAAMTHTSPGTVLGTAGYLSPEQASGEPAGPASDRYALAVVAFELLSGRRPYERDSFAAEAAAHVNERVPSIRAVVANRALPRAIDSVFRRALAKRPDRRYPSAIAFVDALEDVLALVAVTAEAPTDVAAPGAELPPTAVIYDARRERMQGWWARRPALRSPLGIAALLVLAAMLALALAASGGDGRASTTSPKTPSRASSTNTISRSEAIDLHERGFDLLQAGRYAEALALEQRALPYLRGVEPYEAYTNYDIGAALLGLGRCAEAIPYLDRSEQLQGSRAEIDAAKQQAQECLAPKEPKARPAGKPKGKHGHDKH